MTKKEKKQILEAVAKEIAQCKTCKRGKIGLPVPGEGSADANIVFIGEAPGKEEAKTGKPFIGRAGKVLRVLIEKVGLHSEDVFITSPVKYLPKYVTPTEKDIIHGRTHLEKQLAVIEPKIVVVLGAVASHALLGKRMLVAKEHGTILKKDGRTYFLTYHPAAPLYSPSVRPKLVADFVKLKKLLKS